MQRAIMLCLALFALQLALPKLSLFAAGIILPKSGQTVCLDFNGHLTPCINSGQDGDRQLGAAWPMPRFTNNGNGTQTDNLTGLVWLKNANCFAAKNWQQALESANTLMGNNSLCGLGDGSVAGQWRLPNREEQLSLINWQPVNVTMWLGDQGFDDTQADYYWTSTSYAYDAGRKWAVHQQYGKSLNFDSGTVFFVWPVRDGAAVIDVSPPVKDFGSVGVGSASQIFVISNSGIDPLVINSISVAGTDIATFSVATGDGNNGTCGETPVIAPAQSCTVSATFTPVSNGAKSAILRIASNDPVSLVKDVALSGTGTLPTYTVGVSVIGGNGSVSCDSPVIRGSNSVCSINPLPGYHLATFSDNNVDRFLAVSYGASVPAYGTYLINNISESHLVTASFDLGKYPIDPLVRLIASPTEYYTQIPPAYGEVVTSGLIQCRALDFPSDLLLDRPVSVTIEGGFDSAFANQEGITRIKERLAIRSGSLRVKRIAVY